MKRTANKQITKDKRDDEDASSDDENAGAIGIKKASAAVLEKRPMKGLPKRAAPQAAAKAKPVIAPVSTVPATRAETPKPTETETDSSTSAPDAVSPPPKAEAVPEVEKPKSTVGLQLIECKHDVEGPGEEDEETLHACKASAYKLTKDADGKAQWAPQGVGFLRLKQHKTNTSSKRILMRNSNTGNIVMNFALHADLASTHEERLVSFTGHDDGKLVAFKLRLKTAEEASSLQKTLIDASS